MTTLLQEKTQVEIAYPEIPNLPSNKIGFCPLIGRRSKRWPPDMPKDVQKAIAEAVPTFGMSIRVFYPARYLRSWGNKGDPLVIGEKDGKFYLIAAWE